jgi:1-acyl-sn-glycerol-3-phosphate acyltransferase
MPYSYLCIAVCLLIGLFPKTAPILHWIDRCIWAPGWIRLSGVKVRVTGAVDALDPEHAYVVVANHQGHFDIPAAKVALGEHTLLFVTKRSLLFVPLVGLYLWRAGYPLIDRASKSQARDTLDRAAQQVRDGTTILVFPEGTRSGTGEIEAFKRGAFVLAIKAQRPIVPVTITGSMAIMHRDSPSVRTGEIHIHVGDVIPTEGLDLDARSALSDQVREVILTQYERQRTPIDSHPFFGENESS